MLRTHCELGVIFCPEAKAGHAMAIAIAPYTKQGLYLYGCLSGIFFSFRSRTNLVATDMAAVSLSA